MRILHLIQRPQLRGAEVFASQIGALHASQEHDVRFVALFANPAQTQLQLATVPLQELRLDETKRRFDLAGYRTLATVIREFNPDLVQANAADTLKYAALSKRLFGWPGKLVFRNANKIGDFITSTPKRIYNQLLINQVDMVASVSENCRVDFLETFRFPEQYTHTLTIGTPEVAVPTAAVRSAVRQGIGLSDDHEVLINVGSFVPEKNHLGLLELFQTIRERRPAARLVLVGDGKLRPAVEEAIGKLGLGSSVQLLGFRQDAVALVGAADLMLMPSYIEGMPGVILEAMIRQVPVIASDVGGINEVVHHGVHGYLGDPHQPETFVDPVVDLLDHPAQRAVFGERARTFTLASKTIKAVGAEFMSAYRTIL